MYSNVLISGIGVSYPEHNVTTYNQLEEYFKKQDIRIENLMKMLGKNKRFSIDEKVDFFSLIKDASDKAFKKANLNPENIDILVAVVDTPEYITPTNAIKIAKVLGVKNVKVVYDMNANCSGAIVAIDQVSNYLKANKHYKNALITTVFIGSYLRRETDPISYGTFSDAASSIILRKVEEDKERGVIDSNYKADYNYDNMDVFPAKGFKDMLLNKHRSNDEIMIDIGKGVDLSFIPDMWESLITDLLNANKLNAKAIERYYFSQFSLFHIISTMGKLRLTKEKCVYVGDKYGYTGCCSPIFALDYSFENEKIEEDSFTILCGVGAGYTAAALLYKN
ncbi:3-oxoacyl-[acyl-carrier-protein] synthase III C-terminal domain-containing protein [Clostridium beijerinckii]|uniref:3-oxoacyl-[acyl-carrier-protein] synthase III C-terminal domain-containing protein n=1 Tax=Clostridium beijerinckii TaxID=1520 RepID=UPI00098C78EB|nr:3-oxoacyl-[acyl-carrier-protein] synthase III C-terminal domain-containing protein [Clostridium beijerinckii]NRT80598.1 3-oxoacyl-[acyl-carrier-protein] synthase-3 [Clostridium beijerinckii]OOM47519.1 3-oxoacyl-[acyl-carrier-protein] synthase 3 [Clostridium beijerinckii]